jgi:uncharacterized membrane protein YhaH (DUF805 family)
MNLAALFLAPKGRISRRTFWIGAGVLIVWSVLVFVVLWSIFGASLIQHFLGRVAAFPFKLLTIYFAYNLAAKRFNDRGRPIVCAQAVAALAAFKALLDIFAFSSDGLGQLFVLAGTGIALWYFIELGLMRGTVGSNEHGADPEAAG